jgi:hypothetical protein
MKQPRTRSTAPLSLAPPVADLPVTSEAPAAPPSALAEVDRLRLHNAQLQLQVDDLLIAQHARGNAASPMLQIQSRGLLHVVF